MGDRDEIIKRKMIVLWEKCWYTDEEKACICERKEESIMRNMEIEKEMYRLAVELIEKRYPFGWSHAGST